MKNIESIGHHLTVEYVDCDIDIINSPSMLDTIMVQAAKNGNATVLSSHFHKFLPQGASGVVILAESHISIHTWPELGWAAVDIFTCGSKMKNYQILEEIGTLIKAKNTKISADMKRNPF